MRRALLSVSDRTGLEGLAARLQGRGVEILASGGTATHLREHGLSVTDVSEATGFPEIFAGRVKTLHPLIHGGILGPSAEAFSEANAMLPELEPIDLVVVNLYPFAAALAAGAAPHDLIEQIDIGGPALLRAAAKNHARVTVLSSADQYQDFVREIDASDGQTSLDFRRRCAMAAFEHVAAYDRMIAAWMRDSGFGGFSDQADSEQDPNRTTLRLRYGENPHQTADCSLPAHPDGDLAGIGLSVHGGKVLSYNNLVDTVAALKLVGDFQEPACAVIKHTNPCGVGLGPPRTAMERALLCDPVSAFGGIVAFNGVVDLATAELLRGRFLEVIAAAGYRDGALDLLRTRKNLRVLTWDAAFFQTKTRGRMRGWGDLLLTQDEDEGFPELENWRVAAGTEPDEAVRRDLTLAWTAAKHGKSNAIVITRGGATLGCGFGQMSRVDSVRLAVAKAGREGLDLLESVAASDGFFPFPDGIEELARAGVRWILAPGGSMRDEEVAAAANDLGVTLIVASRRHFHH